MKNLKPYIEIYNKEFYVKYEKAFVNELLPLGRKAKKRGYFTRNDIEEIVGWKTKNRSLYRLEKNERKIITTTKNAFSTKDIYKKLKGLVHNNNVGIKGVGVAVASACLTTVDIKNFAIIDTFAWSALQHEGEVTTKTFGCKERGIRNYLKYLNIIRKLMREQNINTAHDVDKGLMIYGKKLKQKEKVKS